MDNMVGNIAVEQKHVFEMGKVLTMGIWTSKVLAFPMMPQHHSSIGSIKMANLL